MRPARGDRRSPQRVKDGQTDVRENIIVVSDGPVVRENTSVVPLAVEAEEFPLRIVPKIRVPTGEGSDSSENCVPSREMHEGVVRRSDAVVSTTSVAGEAAPADLAGTDVPAVAGMKLSAVAEVYSSAVDDEGDPLVIRAGEQRGAVVEVDTVWPGGECRGLVDGMTVPEPLEHSVVGVPIEVGNSSVDRVAVSHQIEHSGVRGTADPPSASKLMMHSEVSGDWELIGRTICAWRFGRKTSGHCVGCRWLGGSLVSDGWAGEVEIEFMIQVTILATSVF